MTRIAVGRLATSRLGISRRDRRTLALGSAVLAVLLSGSRGVPAWRAWVTESRASASELSGQVARIRAAVPLRKALRDTLRARRGRVAALEMGLVEGDTPAVAAATLASMLSESAAAAGVKQASV